MIGDRYLIVVDYAPGRDYLVLDFAEQVSESEYVYTCNMLHNDALNAAAQARLDDKSAVWDDTDVLALGGCQMLPKDLEFLRGDRRR